MKKLLILGGSRFVLPVIEKAHQFGYWVITCDYLPTNYAHKYSDQYCNISIVEKEKVLAIAQNLRIDGIMSFACDPGVITAAYVAEKMGLPYGGSFESVSILQNKAKFRQFLLENHFNVPKAKGYASIEDALKDANTNYFNFPVIVKPVDSAGSKGVKKVDSVDILQSAIESALTFSHSKHFIIEEYIEKVGDSSDCECFSVDGEMKYISFSNQKFDKAANNPFVPSGFTWPPEMPQRYQEELIAELRRLCQLLHMKTSLYNVEARIGKDGKAYLMEVSPRGGGNRLAEMMNYVTGVDLIEESVKAAMGDNCKISGMPRYSGYWYEYIIHTNNEGIYKGVWIDEIIKNKVVEKDLWITRGTRVKEFTGANESIGTIVFGFDSQDEMNNIVNNIEKYVKVVVGSVK